MIIPSKKSISDGVIQIVNTMSVSAKTAPKSFGLNIIDTVIITGEDLIPIANEMQKIYKEYNQVYFLRDSKNILDCDALLLIGTKFLYRNLEPCNLCLNNNCKKTKKNDICIFNTLDLGIATGYACNIASINHLDYRVFFTAAKAALNLKRYLLECKIMISIPVAAKSKNIFYDRK